MFRRNLMVGLCVLLLLLGVTSQGAWAASPPMALAAGPSTPGISYFSFTLAPGASQSAQLRVANISPSSVTALISAVSGATGPTSGDVYMPPTTPCAGSSCWLTGLRPQIPLAAQTYQLVPFTVNVPSGARPGQYLAGLTVKAATVTTARQTVPGQKASISATVIREVTVGVAITVTGGPLHSALAISSVRAVLVGKTPAVAITEINQGNTFLHPKGQLAIDNEATQHVLPVMSGTILPGTSAILRVALPRGLWHKATSNVTLCANYPGIPPCVSWAGAISIPKVPVGYTSAGVPVEHHQFLPTISTTSVAEYAAMAAGAGLVTTGLLLLFLFAMRRRRRRMIILGPEQQDQV